MRAVPRAGPCSAALRRIRRPCPGESVQGSINDVCQGQALRIQEAHSQAPCPGPSEAPPHTGRSLALPVICRRQGGTAQAAAGPGAPWGLLLLRRCPPPFPPPGSGTDGSLRPPAPPGAACGGLTRPGAAPTAMCAVLSPCLAPGHPRPLRPPERWGAVGAPRAACHRHLHPQR